MTTVIPQCAICKHVDGRVGRRVCPAFPEGIPQEIIWTKIDHRTPIKGDGGYVWTPRSKGDEHPLGPLEK